LTHKSFKAKKLELKKEDKEKLTQLMRKQSSAIRVAYNMLKELEKEKTKNPHAQIYKRLIQLFPDLPTKYIDSAIYKAKQCPTDKPVVFGGRRLFEKLCKNHLTGKVREGLKKQWREQRQGTLISIGSKADKGNRLTRFENINGQLHLRITTGNREFIPLKPVLVEGVWDRVRYSNGLVPLSAGGTVPMRDF
jgi:hypothetical protein